jgi:hypothetical protein
VGHHEHMTRRGELLARLEWGKTGPGQYFVEGHKLTKVKDRLWSVAPISGGEGTHRPSMTAALEWIAERVEARRGCTPPMPDAAASPASPAEGRPDDDRNYPLPKFDDPRFTVGLMLDVRDVLTAHGYPVVASGDYVGLRQALFTFLYATEED